MNYLTDQGPGFLYRPLTMVGTPTLNTEMIKKPAR